MGYVFIENLIVTNPVINEPNDQFGEFIELVDCNEVPVYCILEINNE